MNDLKKQPLLSDRANSYHPSSYKHLYSNPLNDLSSNSGSDKENTGNSRNTAPAADLNGCCAYEFAASVCKGKKLVAPAQPRLRARQIKAPLKPSSLELCMRLNEPGGLGLWDPPPSSSSDLWDFSDSEAAPASSWSTLPNRSLLFRPLPLDVGRCTCIIEEGFAQGLGGLSLYSLYTNEGQGRQDRKLAVAHHRRRGGRSEFTVAQNPKGIVCKSDESFLGTITANLMGSKYEIWDQGSPLELTKIKSKRLLGVVAFVPTVKTLTGSFRSMRAWVPKHQSMQIKNTNTTQIQHINGLPKYWEEKKNRAHQLVSRVPNYNNISKRYELDFRERAGRQGPRIQASVKNFQLTMEEKGRQTILQLGRIGKSKYLMDYRHPLTGYQAFCICLSSMDSKLCCSV